MEYNGVHGLMLQVVLSTFFTFTMGPSFGLHGPTKSALARPAQAPGPVQC